MIIYRWFVRTLENQITDYGVKKKMKKAVEKVKSGEMTLCQASHTFDVPYTSYKDELHVFKVLLNAVVDSRL